MLAFLQRSVPAPSRRTGVIALAIGTLLTLPAWFLSIPLPAGLVGADSPLAFVVSGPELDQVPLLRQYSAASLILWLSFALLLVGALALRGRPMRPLGIVLLAGITLALPAVRIAADMITAPFANELLLPPFGVPAFVLPLVEACALGALAACGSPDLEREPRRALLLAAAVSVVATAAFSMLGLFTLLPVAALALALGYAITRGPQPIAASILRLSSSVSK
ncbi:hypothetical protein OVN20_00375 [Microcella daejeonensis]|uniref:hypothetical protein n=1 Tax=Microcella daejeonensis TaxID=2994971 RepID=UPI00226E4416|nr:hypothetical protein [Microcella daejeonensis]WAB84074.1 hypothetical protein OVN20_00375 [Microcella daejeonensis]